MHRNQFLDVLRGIAVLMVVVCHYYLGVCPRFALVTVLGRVVDRFFVLSGFLISGLLFSEYKATGAINLRRFWIRRGFKINPPFYFSITRLIRMEALPDWVWDPMSKQIPDRSTS